jgi:membrane protease YdiL (CAAX protease family)
MIEALVYLLAIAAAEAVTAFIVTPWGIVFYIVILTTIIVRSALGKRYFHQQLILPLALVPLLRITSLTIAEMNLPHLWLYPTIYVPLLLAAVAVVILLRSGSTIIVAGSKPVVIAHISKSRAKDIWLKSGWLGVQLGVGATGILFAIAGYPVLKTEPIIADFTWNQIWLPALVLLCIGFVEELIFRGVIQRGAVELFGNWGIVYVSLLFAVLYIGVLPIAWMAFAFVVSLYFGWVVKLTKSILGVALAHALYNIVLYMVIPFF